MVDQTGIQFIQPRVNNVIAELLAVSSNVGTLPLRPTLANHHANQLRKPIKVLFNNYEEIKEIPTFNYTTLQNPVDIPT